MDVRRFADVDDFLAVAMDFLVAREAEHNLILGVCQNVRETPERFSAPPYFATVSDRDRVVAVAIQTPPYQLILSEVDDQGAIPRLADDLVDRALPGAIGPVDHVRAFMAAREARGGPPARLTTSERIFRLSAVTWPAHVGGGARPAEPADRALIARWLDAFMREALEEADQAEVDAMTDSWLAGIGRTLHLWEHDSAIVSLAGAGSRTPNGVRIGPVYTPPEYRARGYASALVAMVSQAQLDAGRRFCFLLTDLANPTSNHIYRTIGYEPVRDVDRWLHHRA